MSGGVDSSVAAAILKQQGYEVIGITMCFGTAVGDSSTSKRPACCGPEAIRDAANVAKLLGIKHYVLNFSKDLEKFVVENFLKEYISGRTPNPCVLCNKLIKFGSLLRKAKELGAQFLATGHYADKGFDKKLGCYLLKKAKDRLKDQSYFLYAIDKRILPFVLFPLASLDKLEVRSLAKKYNLPVHAKLGSQEICFIPNADYRGFLKDRLAKLGKIIKPGPILDIDGNYLGTHKGIAYYTIGQRQGLGIAYKEPLYVLDINAQHNSITLGTKDETYFSGLEARNLNFLYPIKKAKLDLAVKIRYNQQEVKSKIYLSKIPSKTNFSDITAKVIFSQPKSSVACGQAVVFYDKDIVVGGGTISKGVK
jgi:tRNA-specific 2-thiouridylase